MKRWLPIACMSLAVVAFAATAGAVALAVALAGLAVAVGLTSISAPRQGMLVAAIAWVVALACSADLNTSSTLHRWLALATLPAVVPLAVASLAPARPWILRLLTAGAVVAGPIRLLAYDPLRDAECSPCRPLPAWLGHHPELAWLALANTLLAAGIALAALPEARRRLFVLPLIPISLWAATGWHLAWGTTPDASLSAAALSILAGAITVIETLTIRVRVARLAEMLRTGRNAEESLRAALRDDEATLQFASNTGWLSLDGEPAATLRDGQVITPLGDPSASTTRIAHQGESGSAILLAALTPELRIAFEQARLDALLRSQVRELQESRLRVVESADSQRRQAERDLHDGAQQHVLALGMDLRRELARTPGDPVLETCLAECTQALAELREVARGVYPALLTSAGLGPALGSLGPSVVIASATERRFAPAIERTVFLLVCELALRGRVLVQMTDVGKDLVLALTGPLLDPQSLVRERIETLGGTLSEAVERTEVRLPCG